MLAVLCLSFSSKASAQITAADLAGSWSFTCDFTLVDADYEGIVIGNSDVKIAGSSNLSITNFIVPEIQGAEIVWYASFDDQDNIIEFNRNYPSEATSLALANANGDYPYGNPMFYPTWNVVDASTINVPDFTVVIPNHASQTTEIVATVKNGKLTKNVDSNIPSGDMNFAGTYTINVYYQYSEAAGGQSGLEDIEMTVIQDETDNNKYYVSKLGEWTVPDLYGQLAITAVGEGNVLTIHPSFLTVGGTGTIMGGKQYPGSVYDPDLTVTLSYDGDKWEMSAFTTWEYDLTTAQSVYNFDCLWSPMSVKADLTGGEVTPPAEPASFEGTYTVFGYYYDYAAGNYSDDTSFLLVIDENNVVSQIAGYDLTALAEQGFTIYGEVDGNTFTFTSPSGFYLSFDRPFPILGGNPWDSAYTDEGIEMTFENGKYDLSDFSIWLYDVTDGSKTKQLAWIIEDVKVGDVADDEPGDEPGEEEDYTGTYTVTGTYVSYVDGVASNPVNDSFLMTIVFDDYGDYGLTAFAGYDVPDYYGDPACYLEDEGDVLSIYTTGMWCWLSLGEVSDLVGPADTDAYNEDGVVNIKFNSNEEGEISDFTVWQLNSESGEYTLLASWSNLTFVAGDQTSAVESIIDNNAPVEFYNLQGVKVQNPSNGIYIIRQGNSTKKAVIK